MATIFKTDKADGPNAQSEHAWELRLTAAELAAGATVVVEAPMLSLGKMTIRVTQA